MTTNMLNVSQRSMPTSIMIMNDRTNSQYENGVTRVGAKSMVFHKGRMLNSGGSMMQGTQSVLAQS